MNHAPVLTLIRKSLEQMDEILNKSEDRIIDFQGICDKSEVSRVAFEQELLFLYYDFHLQRNYHKLLLDLVNIMEVQSLEPVSPTLEEKRA